ncbi:MAG: hypothetical protein EZS28_037547 [Streblomastix strix]|uniref:Uncharacterized protein n=1 Tax=Streblomastix strix TaxID=222440 RepID=A0A5J4U8N6_9EUKA|nr:MAG: hypothetical protein EZS28_037547 [Streblomastix strix]
MVGARTGIRPMGWPFFKNVQEFNKTGTVGVGTVREFLYIKVHYKDTHNDHNQATGYRRRDRQVSLVRATVDITRHRTTTNAEASGQ